MLTPQMTQPLCSSQDHRLSYLAQLMVHNTLVLMGRFHHWAAIFTVMFRITRSGPYCQATNTKQTYMYRKWLSKFDEFASTWGSNRDLRLVMYHMSLILLTWYFTCITGEVVPQLWRSAEWILNSPCSLIHPNNHTFINSYATVFLSLP